MAKYEFGIGGPFSGKVGTVVGCTWKGIPYMRSLPKKRTGKVPPGEQANRNKFEMAQRWLKPLTPFLRVGYKGYRERVEGFLAAKSYLLKNAMELREGQAVVDPEKMLVSFGKLEAPIDAELSLDTSDQLQFIWKVADPRKAGATDQAMLLAYCPEQNEAVYQTTGAFRKTGTDSLAIPANFKGKSVLVYLAFVSADRQSQSNSVFLGEIGIPED